MAAGTIEAIGLVGSVLGIVDFFSDKFASEPSIGSTVRVKAGLSKGDDENGMEGDIAAAFAWDTNNNYLGKSGGAYIAQGGYKDFTIDTIAEGRHSEYVGIAAEKDAVCVTWITVTHTDQQAGKGGAWTGDIGYNCGQNWYEQQEAAGTLKDGSEYKPRCTWLDQDHSNDITSAAMKFKTKGYGKDSVAETIDNAKACDLTLWGPDNGPINGKPEKRSVLPRQPWMEEKLVISDSAQHKAENLCSSETSWGPDFVGSDGLFCDMGTKTLTPLCSTSNINGCLEIDNQAKVVKKRSTVAKRMVETTHKSYKNINNWN